MSNNTTAFTPSGGTDNTEDITVTVLYSLIGSLGILGNSAVIYVFLSSKKLRRKLVNIYLINQSAIDLTGSILLVASGTITNKAQTVDSGLTGKAAFNILFLMCANVLVVCPL